MSMVPASAGAFSLDERMNYEFPKALYKDGKWDGVSEPDCVDVNSREEQDAQAANGYYPFGTAMQDDTPEVHVLREQLESKGVKVDKRWGIERLQAEIAKAE